MNGRLAFNLLLLAMAAYFAWSATSYETVAARIPILIGVMVLVLQAWITIKEAVAKEAPAAADGEHETPPPGNEPLRVAAITGWMLLYLLLFALIGTLAAGFLFILLFLGTRRDVRRWIALAVAGVTSAVIWLVFVKLMHFELYPGLLFGATLPPL